MPAALEWLTFIDQALLYAAQLMLIGLSFWRAFGAAPGAFRSLTGFCAIFVLILYALRLLLLNAELGGSVAAALQPDLFHWVWAIYDRQAILIGAAIVCAFFSLFMAPRFFSVCAAGALGASFAMAGHASALEHPAIWPWVAAFHVFAAGFWAVAPVILWPSEKVLQTELADRVERYSARALFLVPLLFIAGIVLALRLAGGWSELKSTAYGQLLVAKLAAATLILAAGAVNKLVISRRLTAGQPSGRVLLKTTLAFDATLFAFIIAIIAWATTIEGLASH